jgi:Cu(I)/Ag(I) efflux system membrane protein CusA/SilA
LTLGIIFLLLFLNFRSVSHSLIVMLALPFALVGGVWTIWALGYNTSVAVWVGFIALAGVAAETGVVMLIYLDEAFERIHGEPAAPVTPEGLAEAVRGGAVERLRPVMMTVTAIIAGLAPILWSEGAGADVMKRIAAPMIGGMVTATVLTLECCRKARVRSSSGCVHRGALWRWRETASTMRRRSPARMWASPWGPAPTSPWRARESRW